ncbi:cell wall hydrolase [Sphingomonas sp. 2R-10]|uniref:cell wall hydrolase n=1 Tax=Sphingomonas sp. 2R-10 TaxID=3045148 RepID=UPI0019D24FC4|nr:cell wall hydrolase [Sphingomonas sp. 2R-10]MDJ0278711.1 cell wall hydrolase [Sphingomonas sp. 2R-10]
MAILANLPRRTRILGGGIMLLVVGAFGARAGIAALDQRARAPAPPAAATGYEADDHFPGAAQLLLAAPVRRGETGTAPLPALPAYADAGDLGDASIRPARPFVLRGTQLDRARALQCLTTAIYYEAGNEPDDGQRAVAQVVLNRVRHPAFPASVCGVVFQGSDRPVCQFSFACDGAMARVPAPAVWLRSRRVAARALAGDVFAPVGLATHYHTYAVTPSWNRSLVMTGVFGAHFFHRWKGWWGTPAAFTDRYTGIEPPPGPLRALPPPPPLQTVPVETVPLVPPAVLTPPTPIASATPLPEESSKLPAESQVLDRWKDSGKPLR